MNQTRMFDFQATLHEKLMMASSEVVETSIFYHLQQSFSQKIRLHNHFLLLSLFFFCIIEVTQLSFFLVPIKKTAQNIQLKFNVYM